MSVVLDPSCSNCMSFEPLDNTCHRNPPTRTEQRSATGVVWNWPQTNIVGNRNWCSEWSTHVGINLLRGTA